MRRSGPGFTCDKRGRSAYSPKLRSVPLRSFVISALFVGPNFLGASSLGCTELRTDAPGLADGGVPPSNDATTPPPSNVTVEALASGRNRPGAYSTQGYRPFRSGITILGNEVFWVESGTSPGLYAVAADPASGSSVRSVLSLTQPTAFAAAGSIAYIGDRTQLKRVTLPGGKSSVTATLSNDIVAIAASENEAYIVDGARDAISKVSSAGVAPFINSNGAPVAVALSDNRFIWAGVDISGINGVLQGINTDRTNFNEYKRFSSGFSTISASSRYAYYAHTSPPVVHRMAISSGADSKVYEGDSPVAEFAVTDTHAYWVERGSPPGYENGRVLRVAHDSNKVEVLAVSIPSPVAITALGDVAYVASAGQSSMKYANGAILKISITTR
jgi:hypothetical protein